MQNNSKSLTLRSRSNEALIQGQGYLWVESYLFEGTWDVRAVWRNWVIMS